MQAAAVHRRRARQRREVGDAPGCGEHGERKLLYIPSFKIYCGIAGLYDYGPPGCCVKSNVLSF
jgi:hypothetical protein